MKPRITLIELATAALIVGLIALALLGFRLARAAEPTDVHWRLEALKAVDGYVKRALPLNKTRYKTAGACISDGLLLGPPPPSVGEDGHTVTYSIACIHFKDSEDPSP